MWAALLGLSIAHGATQVRVQLSIPEGRAQDGFHAEALWLGVPQRQELLGAPVAIGAFSGDELRFVPIEIWSNTPKPHRVYAALEPVPAGETELHYVLREDGQQAQRVSEALPGGSWDLSLRSAWSVGGGFAWWTLTLALVAWIASRKKKKKTSTPREWLSHPAVVFAVLTALAVFWTFPAVLAGPEALVGRNFDAPGTLWSLAAGPRLVAGGLMDGATAWPVGGDYRRFDSYTLLPISVLLQFMDPARLHGWLQILGLGLSGTAAALFAKEVGARGIWPLVGGALYAFSGLAATVLLEGHVYQLVNPWLPLFAMMWWRATGPEGHWKQGLGAGALFVLLALTSAYQGLSGALLAIVFFVAGVVRHGPKKLLFPSLAAAAVVLLGALPILLFAGPGSGGSAGVVNLAGLDRLSLSDGELDRWDHSYTLALSGLALALVACVPKLWSGRNRSLLVLFGLGLALCVGIPASNADALPTGLITPLLWLGLGEIVRFPVRLFWSGLLGLSALAALGGWTLQQRQGPRVGWLGALVLVEVMVLHHVPTRQQVQLAQTPSVYSQATGPVLDLFPVGGTSPMEQEMWFNATACLAQAEHGHTSTEHCTTTEARTAPRYRISRRLERDLLEGRPKEAARHLAKLGIVHVAWHVDLFSVADQALLAPGLGQIGSVQESRDGGERLLFYTLNRAPGDGPAEAYGRLKDAVPRSIGQPVSGQPAKLQVLAMGKPQAKALRLDGATIPLTVDLRGEVARADVRLPPGFRGQLSTLDGAGGVLWSGPASLVPGQQLVLDGGVPVLSVPPSISSARREGALWAAWIGLALYLLALGGWLAWLRRVSTSQSGA
ncbi:MAG: hypothetical protein ACI9VR_003088 [Cognaticolwellia sp.]|jgi:hypothetical protein